VLVVEDDSLIAQLIADQLDQLGCSLVGPEFSLMEARLLATSEASRRGPSLQVRTRPTFSVVTSPACSKMPTCFFMPVRVM
jgi:hypothetical protein